MEVTFTPDAVTDLNYWKRSGNKTVQAKISSLLASIVETPFEGIGKPEPLKNELSGKWSRRIDSEHRLIYTVSDKIYVYSLRGHYKR